MSEEKIKRTEVEMLSTAIDRIVSSEILQSVMSDQLPLTSDLTDSNKIYHGKASILFVDMRDSTKLPERFNEAQLVKIYRSYIRTVVQAIRYSGGVVRDFMGDGVLAVFIDNEDGNSEDKAVCAARYITTAVDKLLNPVLDRVIKYRISCGIGIHTGEITLSKVGMKGKEKQEDAEDEFGIAWIGNSTNLACKFSGAVGNGTIFISPSTYSALTDVDGKQMWKWSEIAKGNNILKGYVAKQYYLQLDDEIIPCIAEESKQTLSLVDELKREYKKQLAEIEQKSVERADAERVHCFAILRACLPRMEKNREVSYTREFRLTNSIRGGKVRKLAMCCKILKIRLSQTKCGMSWRLGWKVLDMTILRFVSVWQRWQAILVFISGFTAMYQNCRADRNSF